MATTDNMLECPVCKKQVSILMKYCPQCHTPMTMMNQRPLTRGADDLSLQSADSVPEYAANGVSSVPAARMRRKQDHAPVYSSQPEESHVTNSQPEESHATNSQPEESQATSLQTEESSGFAPGFFVFLAWFLWLGGLLVAYQSANVEVVGRYSSYSEFSWGVFFEIYTIYFVVGSFAMCASEVCKNIQSIADSLKRIEMKKQ